MKMKVTVITMALIALLTAGAQAQTASYGVKAGLAIAKLTGDVEGLDSRTAFMGGLFAAFQMGESMEIQPEVLYASKGAKTTIEGTDVTYKLDFIEIPVLFKYTMSGESARPYLMAGPAIGFNTTAKAKGGGAEEDFKDLIKSTDFSLVFGGGVAFDKFMAEVRYDLGLSNINDDPDFPDDSFKTSAWNFLVGVSF